MKAYIILYILLCPCDSILGKVDTGYPSGYMADCPGMNKTTFISEKTKRSLHVIVIRPNHNIFGYSEAKCKLSFDGAACVAKHLDLRRRKTQVLISGYMDSSYFPLVRSIADIYLSRGRNVIILELFTILLRSYPMAARVAKPLGNLLGLFLAFLTQNGLSGSKLEIIGGSLGAHIASFASEKFYLLTERKISRVTGLDPAGPCFRNMPASERLNPNVADKVDILHTNIDGFGIAEPSGHVDFYANGGEYQPAMIENFLLPCFSFCSHVRSVIYWLSAYDNPDKFIGLRCESVSKARHGDCYNGNLTINVLGPKTDFNKPGIYFLPTTETTPYYLGNEGLKKLKYGANTYLLKTTPDDVITV